MTLSIRHGSTLAGHQVYSHQSAHQSTGSDGRNRRCAPPEGLSRGIGAQVVKRAEDEDMNRNVRYQVAFIRNGQGRVITDVRQLPELSLSPLALSDCRRASLCAGAEA